MASLGLVMVVMEVRRELGDAVDRTDFAIEAALLIVTAVSAAVGALLVSIPGAERARLVRCCPSSRALQPCCGPLGAADRLGHWGSNRALNVCLACLQDGKRCGNPERRVVGDDQARRAAVHGARAASRHCPAAVGVLGANIIPNNRPLHAAVARHAADAVCWPRRGSRHVVTPLALAKHRFAPLRGARDV